MSLPPINPTKSMAGIAVDPQSLDRVVPSSKRIDGSIRKEIKIRPGFTPQEDVSRFRGTRQQEMDKHTLPKGHIVGWVAPSAESKPKPSAAMSKSAKKNEKRKEKKKEEKVKEKEAVIKASWDDDDDEEDETPAKPATAKTEEKADSNKAVDELAQEVEDKLHVKS